ncbi:hypothetical protein Tco_0960290 [Tanacetum coccineum]
MKDWVVGYGNGTGVVKKDGVSLSEGTVSDVITGGTEGAVQQGPVHARVFNDLSAEEKERSVNQIMILYTRAGRLSSAYPTQSSKSPKSSTEPYPSDNFQLNSGSSSTENLIESLSNTLALLTQSQITSSQTNNQHIASSIQGTNLRFRTEIAVQDVREDTIE